MTARATPPAVAAAITLATATIAAVVGAVLAARARAWLDFPFTGIPDQPAQALSVFVANMRLAAGGALAALVAQLPGRRAIRRACDVAVTLAVAGNLVVVGAAVGAYGSRMLGAMLPHGPFELAAFSIMLSFYLRARRERVAAAQWAWTLGAVAVLLAVAAVLETYAA